METLVFATGNSHKVIEVEAMLAGQYHLHSLADIGCTEDIPETSPTIEGNAWQKAHYVVNKYKVDCFAEDTGLEIEALGGEPGIYSARYAGPARDSVANMILVLERLAGKTNRRARFRTVIALSLQGEEHTFEGIVEGTILSAPRGSAGFGYDPIFQPDGYSLSFAEIEASEKNKISHRGKAIQQLLAFLRQRHRNTPPGQE
ncbi:MAG: non-canonical purine NTP diphosphatase [Lewinellaceae bacterium]|nr:non-canonical purine NTP diphosphatase [Lewinellaceae bacterium]